MSKGILRIYYGNGYGKSTAAFGTAVRESSRGKNAIVISFLREKNEESEELLKALEPQLKLFRFEKSNVSFDELSEKEKEGKNWWNQNSFLVKVNKIGQLRSLIA